MRSIVDLVHEECGLMPTKSPEELVEWLQRFHNKLAERLHDGESVLDSYPISSVLHCQIDKCLDW
jgi:hypothetical protein